MEIRSILLLLRHGLVGIFASISNLALLFFFVEFLHLDYRTGVTLSLPACWLIAFYLHSSWTFKKKGKLVNFFFLNILYLALNLLLITAFVELLKIWYLLGQVAAILLLAGLSFLANKYFVFK